MLVKHFANKEIHKFEIKDDTIKAIIASNSLTTHGNIVDIKSMDIEEFKNGGVVLAFHRSDMPVAKPIKTEKSTELSGKDIVYSEAKFSKTRFAQEVKELINEKIILTTSIGISYSYNDIDFKDDHETIHNSHLYEWSLISGSMAANPDAKILDYSVYSDLKGNISNELMQELFPIKELFKINEQFESLNSNIVEIKNTIKSLTTASNEHVNSEAFANCLKEMSINIEKFKQEVIKRSN